MLTPILPFNSEFIRILIYVIFKYLCVLIYKDSYSWYFFSTLGVSCGNTMTSIFEMNFYCFEDYLFVVSELLKCFFKG